MCGGSGQCLTILRLSFISRMRASDLKVKLDAEHETVWLTQTQIAELFGIKRPAITKHLGNIFSSGELDRDSVSSILEHTAMDGKVYKTQFYNLDAIILVGYRVNSINATAFRRWATGVLRDYLLKGYSVNRHLVALQESMDKRMTHIEDTQAKQQQQLDFFIRTSTLRLLRWCSSKATFTLHVLHWRTLSGQQSIGS